MTHKILNIDPKDDFLKADCTCLCCVCCFSVLCCVALLLRLCVVLCLCCFCFAVEEPLQARGRRARGRPPLPAPGGQAATMAFKGGPPCQRREVRPQRWPSTPSDSWSSSASSIAWSSSPSSPSRPSTSSTACPRCTSICVPATLCTTSSRPLPRWSSCRRLCQQRSSLGGATASVEKVGRRRDRGGP